MTDAPSKPEETDEEGFGAASFWEHLGELRNRLLVTVATTGVGFFGAWIMREGLFQLVTRPVRQGLAQHGIYQLTAIETVEAIVVYLKLSIMTAIVMTVPVFLYQVWAFVKPGLTGREIRPMRRIVVFSIFMFFLGLTFCYSIVLPLVMDYLTGFTMGSGGVDFQVTMRSAYSTALTFLFGFGAIFELPLVMVLLAATPLLDYRKYLKWIRYFIALSFVIGSLLTPPDVLSQILMAIPLTVLYLVGIALSYFMEKKREQGDDAREIKGFDPYMVLGAVVLSIPIALLVMPGSYPARAYLPHGAKFVATARAALAGELSCGQIATATFIEAVEEDEVTCAVYPEGHLLMASFEGEGPGDLCEKVAPAVAGNDLACLEKEGSVVVGHPLLLARLESNLDNRRVDSGPHTVSAGGDFDFFISLESSRKKQSAFLAVALLPGDGEKKDLVRVSLAFPDPDEAAQFAKAVEKGGEIPFTPAGDLARPPDRLVEALDSLCDAVDNLSDRLGDEAATVKKKVARARELLALEGAARRGLGAGLTACTSPSCAYANLFSYLFPPEGDVEVTRRTVEFEVSYEGKAEAMSRLVDYLLETLAGTSY